MRRQQRSQTGEITSAALAYLLKRRLWLAADIAAITLVGGSVWWSWLNIVPNVDTPAPAPLPSPNAFDSFARAGTLIADKEVIEGATGKPDYLPRERNSVPYSNAEIAAAVGRNEAALAKLRTGFSYSYQNPSRRGFDSFFPEFAQFRGLARLLNVEGRVREAKGDFGGAAQSRLDAMQLGIVIPRGGSLIPSLVGIACESIGRRPLWSLADKLNASEARAAAKRLEDISAQRVPAADVLLEEKWSTQEGLLQEFQAKTTLQAYREMMTSLSGDSTVTKEWYQDVSETAPLLGSFLKTSKTQIIANHSSYMDSAMARARLPYMAASRAGRPAPPSDPINAVIFPIFEAVHIKTADTQMQTNLLTAVFALRAYQAEHGAFPGDLNALVTAGYLSRIPADPFTESGNAPVQYRRLENGKYLLYSIGPDGKDDAGTPIQPKSNSGNYRTWVEAGMKGDFVIGVNNVRAGK